MITKRLTSRPRFPLRPIALGCALALSASGGTQAVVVLDIDFSEVPVFTADPVIDGVAFSAGDPLLFEDTVTDDFASPTDPYLISGVEGSGATDLPGFASTAFIQVDLPAAQGGAGSTTTVSLDAGFFAPLPSGETIQVDALLGGVVQGSTQVTSAIATLNGLTIDLGTLSFDRLMVFVPSNFGGIFRIDNLVIDVASIVVPPPVCGDKNASAVAGEAETCIEGGTLLFDSTDITVGANVNLGALGGSVDTAGQDGRIDGVVFGTGGLRKLGAGNLVLTGINTFSGPAVVTQGFLTVLGSLDSDVDVEIGGTLRGTGYIRGDTTVFGRLAPGQSPGTLTFGGPVAMAQSGTLQIDIDGTGTGNGAGNYSRVLVEGAGFAAAGTLEPRLRDIGGDATNAFNPTIGQGFTVVQAQGGVTGTFAALTQPVGLPSGTRFDALYDPNAVRLALTPADYSQLPNQPLTGNAQAVGGALNGARPAAHAPKDALYSALAVLDEPSVARVLQQMGGEIHADMISAGFNTQRLSRDTIMSRLDDLRLGRATQATTGLSSQGDPSQQVWIQASGGWIDTDGDSTANGYDENLWGTLGGIDFAINPSLRLGAAIGYSQNDVDAGSLGDGEIDTTQLMAYGLWQQGEYFANFALGYGWDSYETDRHLDLPTVSVLSSDTDGSSAFLDAEAGLRLEQEGYAIEPTLGLRGDLLDRDGFTESGGLGALSVEGESYQALQTRLGGKVARTLELGNGQRLTPELRAYWLHDFGDAIASRSDAILAGQRFSVDAPDQGRDALALGLGLRMEAGKDVALFLDYDFSYRSDQTAQELVAGVQVLW